MSHSKDLRGLMSDQELAALVKDVVGSWGRVEIPLFAAASAEALAGVIHRSLESLVDAGALTGAEAVQLSELAADSAAASVPAELATADDVTPAAAENMSFVELLTTALTPSPTRWRGAAVCAAAALGEAVNATGGTTGATFALSSLDGWTRDGASGAD